MPRLATGQIIERDGKLCARVRWLDTHGRTRAKERQARNRSHARHLIRQLEGEISEATAAAPTEVKTFADLASQYLTEESEAGAIHRRSQVSGMRAHRPARVEVNVLREYFTALSDITHAAVEAYRNHRL